MKFPAAFCAALAAVSITLAVPVEGVAGQAAPRKTIEISHDNGGSVVDYTRRMTRARQQSTQVVFRGQCASACTVYLALPKSQTCIRPGAKFGFHKAYGASRQANQWGTEFLLGRYPSWVRAWIDAKGGLTDRVIWMDYAYASKHLPTCARA